MLPAAHGRRGQHGKIQRFGDPDRKRSLAGMLPGYASLGIVDLRQVDQLGERVSVHRVDRGRRGDERQALHRRQAEIAGS